MDADIERTRAYYHSLSHAMLCDCDYCKLYYTKSSVSFPKLAQWLEGYGVDISKPFEASSVGPDENGMIDYISVQYIVFGSCPEDFHINIGEIEVRLAVSYPSTGIREDHFLFDIFPLKLEIE